MHIRRLGLDFRIPTYSVGFLFPAFYKSLKYLAEFLGANDFDDMPFIVAPLMKNGNARMYIRNNQYCDRLKIVRSNLSCVFVTNLRCCDQLYDVSLGMVYLHSQNIVHGDLKAVLRDIFDFLLSLSHTELSFSKMC